MTGIEIAAYAAAWYVTLWFICTCATVASPLMLMRTRDVVGAAGRGRSAAVIALLPILYIAAFFIVVFGGRNDNNH